MYLHTISISFSYHHSLLPGRSFQTTPSLSLKYSNFTRDRGLVNTHATCSRVENIGYLWRFSTPYPICNDTLSLCALSYHGTSSSLLT